jgi:hypothetical protein
LDTDHPERLNIGVQSLVTEEFNGKQMVVIYDYFPHTKGYWLGIIKKETITYNTRTNSPSQKYVGISAADKVHLRSKEMVAVF